MGHLVLYIVTYPLIASMSLQRGMCRLSLPAGSYVRSQRLFGFRSPISRPGCTQRILPPLNFSSCPLPEAPSFSKPSSSEFRMSKMCAAGCSSFSTSSASAIGSTTSEDVLEFWFKDVGPESGHHKKEWFMGGQEFDGECEKNFGESLKLARAGELEGWLKSARGRLALVILLDQMSRNIYRNSASSYSHDAIAVKITLDTIEQGLDKELSAVERWFLYIPLMHSESLGDHEIAERLFEGLAAENSEDEGLHKMLAEVVEFERKHAAVVKRFGRYPSRNAVLGRANTKEEEEFLASGGGW